MLKLTNNILSAVALAATAEANGTGLEVLYETGERLEAARLETVKVESGCDLPHDLRQRWAGK